MSKKLKTNHVPPVEPTAGKQVADQEPTPSAEVGVGSDEAEASSVMPMPEPIQIDVRESALFELYLARVSHAETINTMRRDVRKIFTECYLEAQVALEVYENETKKARK